MGLLPPSTGQVAGKPPGPLKLLLGGLAFVLLMWGVALLDLLKRAFR